MSLRQAFFEFYRRARSLIAPKLKYSQAVYEAVVESYVTPKDVWLDVGCGHAVLPDWRIETEKRLVARAMMVVGLDPDMGALRQHRSIELRVQGDASRLPFNSGRFSLISSNMVFEHLTEPPVQLAEIFRVLGPGGILIFHTPNAYGYGVILGRLLPNRLKVWLAGIMQGREPEDVYPAFYRINSEKRIRILAASVGFQVREMRMIVSTPVFVMFPPLVIFELLLLRLLMTKWLRSFRTNIICVLEKPGA